MWTSWGEPETLWQMAVSDDTPPSGPRGQRIMELDPQTTVSLLKEWVRAFSRERDWEQFHHPKDLGLALACEVGEVLEHFRYRTNDEIRASLQDAGKTRELAHELADCLWVLLRLADTCGVDLASSLREKIDLAALKYPIDQAFGRPDKYTSYLPRGDGPG